MEVIGGITSFHGKILENLARLQRHTCPSSVQTSGDYLVIQTTKTERT